MIYKKLLNNLLGFASLQAGCILVNNSENGRIKVILEEYS